ncbi:MAG: hypothetical protein N2712_07815, partial [Brevinematales bacterium]|nr:hypothetical protein [Brevinematales bacterium]
MGFPLIFGALLTGAVTTVFYGIWAGLVMAGLTLLMGLISPVPKTNLKPASLSDFKFTQADEGQPIPLVYGIVKIPGNIIYYG